MDDLLIVRLSDRSKRRFERRRSQAPLGASLGIALGAAFGLLFASRAESEPALALAFGIALGIAVAGLLGRFVRPGGDRRRAPRPFHYDGMPGGEERAPEGAERP